MRQAEGFEKTGNSVHGKGSRRSQGHSSGQVTKLLQNDEVKMTEKNAVLATNGTACALRGR